MTLLLGEWVKVVATQQSWLLGKEGLIIDQSPHRIVLKNNSSTYYLAKRFALLCGSRIYYSGQRKIHSMGNKKSWVMDYEL